MPARLAHTRSRRARLNVSSVLRANLGREARHRLPVTPARTARLTRGLIPREPTRVQPAQRATATGTRAHQKVGSITPLLSRLYHAFVARVFRRCISRILGTDGCEILPACRAWAATKKTTARWYAPQAPPATRWMASVKFVAPTRSRVTRATARAWPALATLKAPPVALLACARRDTGGTATAVWHVRKERSRRRRETNNANRAESALTTPTPPLLSWLAVFRAPATRAPSRLGLGG